VAAITSFRAFDSPVIPAPASFALLGAEGTVAQPVPCFLIEHERGLVVVDTGLDQAAIEDPIGTYGEPIGGMLAGHYRPEHAIDRQLAQLGYAPDDVDTVVMTHLHFDHSGGMGRFESARFIGGRGEIEHAFWPDPGTLAAGYCRIEDFGFLREARSRWVEVGPAEHDLFGDGSVVVFHLPGHTPGQLAVLVRAPHQTFILTSDIVHLRAGLEGIPCPFDWDAREAARSVGRVQALASAYQAELWISHDPLDWERFGGRVYSTQDA